MGLIVALSAFRSQASRWDRSNISGPGATTPMTLFCTSTGANFAAWLFSAAWLDHNDSRSINSLDILVIDENGDHLRSPSPDGLWVDPGKRHSTYRKRPASVGSITWISNPLPYKWNFGLAVPYWAHAHYPGYSAVGGFEAATFRPDSWVPDYPNPAFLNRLPDDEFWAAKQVMAFTDEQIRAIVKVAEYSDPAGRAIHR